MLFSPIDSMGCWGPPEPPRPPPLWFSKQKGNLMHDPRTTRRLALALSGILVVALACTCKSPLDLTKLSPGGGVNGRVWFDRNGDGLQDEGEEGVPAVLVQLVTTDGTVAEDMMTGEDGSFAFLKAKGGNFALGVIPPEGFGFTVNDVGSDESLDSDVIPASGQTELFSYNGIQGVTRDAGLVPAVPKATNTPRPTATSAVIRTDVPATEIPADTTPKVHITYEHTAPGRYSEIVIIFSNMAEGQEISGAVLGSGVSGDGGFTAVGGADGTCEIRVRITSYGIYDVDIPELGISQTVTVVAATATPY